LASTAVTYVILSIFYALILSRSTRHLRTAWYHLGIHIWVSLVAVGFLFWGEFRQRHDLLFLTVSQRHNSKLNANYCLIDVKALLLFVIISAIPLPKIYKVLSGKRSTLLPSARNSAQTLEENTTSSKFSRTLRASISFFSQRDWELVYGKEAVVVSSAPRINEAGISPSLEIALGNQRSGQQTRLDIKQVMKIGGQTQTEREEQGEEPRQRDTQEGNEKAEDRTEKSDCEAWCCGCGRIEIFPQRICDNCRSSLCPSCIQTD
jgi:hypothetical protein